MSIEKQRTVPRLPVFGLRGYILGLATAHGVTYVKAPLDEFTDMIDQISDGDVNFDEIELLLIALARAGVIASDNVALLHINYLREKLNVRLI